MKPASPSLKTVLVQYGVPFYCCLGAIVLVVLLFVVFLAPD